MLKIHVIKSILFTHVNTVLYITKTDALCLDQNKLIFILFNYGLVQSNGNNLGFPNDFNVDI